MYTVEFRITDTSGTGLLSVVERCPLLEIAYPLEVRISIQSVSVVGGCPLLGMPVLGDSTVYTNVIHS